MRQMILLFYLVLLYPTATVANLPNCDELHRVKLEPRNWNVCNCRTHLGNKNKYTMLDFSKTDENTMEVFFIKMNKCEKLHGMVIIEGNDQLKTINFGKTVTWSAENVPKGGLFISIRNNPNLKSINFFEPAIFEKPDNPVAVFIYNNPQLETDTFDLFKKAVDDWKMTDSLHIIDNTKCYFEDPVDSRSYPNPNPEILKWCKSIKGDFIIENGHITQNMQLDDDACLRLIRTDMSLSRLTFSGTTGKKTCKDPNFISAIEDNPNLCDENFIKLQGYFPDVDKEKIPFKMDVKTCQKSCTLQADVNKYMCTKITGPFDISPWFKKPSIMGQADALVDAEDGTVTIQGVSVERISMSHLRSIGTLILKDNPNLKELHLPELEKISKLEIINCPKLLAMENMARLAHNHPAILKKQTVKSPVECITTNSTVIRNVDDLRLCTAIIGPLKLTNIRSRVNRSHFEGIEKITGCVTVEDTTIKNFEFLRGTVLEPSCSIIARNNPYLCPYDADLGKLVDVEGTYNRKCETKCTIIDKKCLSFVGDLVIKGKKTLKKLENLRTVYGSIEVSGTDIETLDLPQLQVIESPTAPALYVHENPYLHELHLPVLRSITVAGNSRAPSTVEFFENGELLLTDVNSALLVTGIKCHLDSLEDDPCQFASYESTEMEEKHTRETEEIQKKEDMRIEKKSNVAWFLFTLCMTAIVISSYINVRLMMNLPKSEVERKPPTIADFPVGPENYKYRNPRAFPITNKMIEQLVPMINGILTQDLLELRYKFHHGTPTSDKFSHEKMNFNRNVHLCCDEYPDKMADFIRAIEERNPGRMSSGAENGYMDEDMDKLSLPRFPVLHVGRGFLLTLYRTMHWYPYATIKRNRIYSMEVLARPEIDTKNFTRSTLLVIYYYNDAGKKKEAAIELTEIYIDYEFRNQLHANSQHKWMDWIFRAVQEKEIIQTDCGEGYLMIYFVISTIDLLMGVYGQLDKKELEEFPLAMYERYMELYRGGEQSKRPTSAKDVWLLWVNYMLMTMSRVLKDQPHLAKLDSSATADTIKKWLKKRLIQEQRTKVRAFMKKWRDDEEEEEEKGKQAKKDEKESELMTKYGKIKVDGIERDFNEERNEKMRMPGPGMGYQEPIVPKEWQDSQFLAIYYKNQEGNSSSTPATTMTTPKQ